MGSPRTDSRSTSGMLAGRWRRRCRSNAEDSACPRRAALTAGYTTITRARKGAMSGLVPRFGRRAASPCVCSKLRPPRIIADKQGAFANGRCQAIRDRRRDHRRRRRRHGGRHRGARCRSARHRLRAGLRARRRRHHLRRRLPDRRIAAAEAERHPRHARPRLQGLDRMGRPVGRRGLGALLHRAHPARSLSLGRRLRREVGRPESPGGQLRAPLDPTRAQRSRPDDPPDRRLSPEGRRDRRRDRDHRAHDSRAAASPACKAAMPRPASRWRCAARPSSWRPAASTRTSTWCSSSIPLSATTRCWKDRGAARPAADTSSFARPAAISPTWTTSGSTSTPRPTTATRRSAAASCSVWCPATSGSTSRAAAFTTRRCRAATPRAPR